MISLRRRQQESEASTLSSRRLRLVSMTEASLSAEESGSLALGKALQVEVVPDWPPSHWNQHVRVHILTQLAAFPETAGWYRYMVLAERPGLLIGSLGAFPCAAGDVELGYSVATSQQRRGYGTEAAQVMVDWLLQQPAIHSVSAQSYTSNPDSIGILQRCGMRLVGAGDDPGTVRYRRWR